MPLFILTETSAGYGLFKATDKKLLDSDNLGGRLSTAAKIAQEIKYKEFAKFDSAASALEEISGVIEGKVTPKLAGLLNEFKNEKKVSLAVAEKNLGNSILKLPDLNIKPISDSSTAELFRAIRQYLPELIPGILPENFKEMSLGLSHSLSRHKLKFSPDKVDVMVIQAISLLDDLDKELNTYAMRVKEWYGWHFPELSKILNDNLAYARVILAMGMRSNAPNADLAEILPEEIEAAVKAAADISMGTEITNEDLENIRLLAEQVVEYSEYRAQLSQYLENRMRAIAPNMTELVGYLVGARLIAHAGSLMNLAKNPGSTIQILGAEKALFRALKTKHATPKYGLIYHASLVGQATGKNKGKIARQLASKVAIGVRVDALAEYEDDAELEERAELGIRSRSKIENNLRKLEGKPLLSKGVAVGPNGQALPTPSKWNVKEARKYNADADGLAGDEPAADVTTEGKKSKRDKTGKIAEVKDVPEIDMADAEDDDDVENEDEDIAGAAPQNGTLAAPYSPTLPSVSDDTEEEAELPTGASREAKKAWKKERKAQEKRRTEREERRSRKNEQLKRQAARGDGPSTTAAPKVGKAAPAPAGKKELGSSDYERLAKLAGMSTSKFIRRFERGQIQLNDDGTLNVLSKKELKAPDRTEEEDGVNGRKRKHVADAEDADVPQKEEKPKKKKKKHHKSSEVEA